MKHIDVASVAPHETLVAQGGCASIRVRGDVGEGATLTAQGGSATIEVDGYVGAHASLVAQGGGAKVIVRGGKHGTARTVAQGGGSEVKISGGPKPPPDRSGLEFGEFGIFGSRPPRPPRPPKPPKPPRMPDWFTVTDDNSVVIDSFRGGSLRVSNGEVWVDGVKVESNYEAPVTDHSDNPVHGAGAGGLTVQKSQRPREQWGT